MNDNSELKRLNFFPGLFTSAQDWIDEQTYQRDKDRRANQVLHRPGIAHGLRVVPEQEGGLFVWVQPGMALDPAGNLLNLTQARKVSVPAPDDSEAEKYEAERYVVIEFAEKDDTYVANVQDPEYSGYTRKREEPRIVAGPAAPTANQLALARITLPAHATSISEANITPATETSGAIDPLRDRQTEDIEKSVAWIDQDHLKQRLLLNQRLHRPGVLPAEGQELKVVAAGGLQVRILPGVALDGNGKLIFLTDPTTLPVVVPSVLPATVYITIEYVATPDPSGEALRYGVARLACRTETPDALHLELARICLQPDVQEIKDAVIEANPVGNEIDLRAAAKIGAVDPARDQQLAAIKERMRRLHAYHLEKQKRHNRGLHTVGVLHGIPNGHNQLTEFSVLAHQGLTVQVGAGAALDADGNEIYLDEPRQLTLTAPSTTKTRYYIAVRFDDPFADYLADLAQPFAGKVCTAELTISTDKPTNSPWLELAHIDLAPGATTIAEPGDPANPQPGEIDRRDRPFSGAVGLAPERLSAHLQQRLTTCMQTTRQHFATLAARFPTPPLEDIRYGALHLQMSAVTIAPEQLIPALSALAAVEQSSEAGLIAVCAPLAGTEQFIAYQAAIADLNSVLRQNQPTEIVLDRQQAVAEAALTLANVVFPLPVANAGEDQKVQTADVEVNVILDASASKPGAGRKIVKYRWEQL